MNIHHVIPAQAGIQSLKESPRSGTTPGFCLLRSLFDWLDSRFRGNDTIFDLVENQQ